VAFAVPRTVRLASVLLLTCAAVAGLDALAGGVAMQHFQAAVPAYLKALGSAGVEDPTTVPELRAELRYNLIVAIAAALVFAALGWAVRRPRRLARRLTWCAAAVLLYSVAIGVAADPETQGRARATDPAEVRAAQENLLVAWYSNAHGATVILAVAAVAAAAWLLAGTSAGDFYRLRHQDGGPGLYTFLGKT
jgi:hypothetical protein